MLKRLSNKDSKMLKKLAKYPCGDLASIAKRVLNGKIGKRVFIPYVKKPLKVIFKKNMGRTILARFYPWTNEIKVKRGKNALASLIHEFRHAQQRIILRQTFFDCCVDMGDDYWNDALEIDADAAEIAYKTTIAEEWSWDWLGRKSWVLLRKSRIKLENHQAKVIGKPLKSS
jgi:hypothetical protein